MDKEHILNEIKRTTYANAGTPLGRSRFCEETGIREVDWKGKYWINWSDAIKEAGFKPNNFNKATDEEVLLNKVAIFIRELGHFPQRAELVMKRNSDASFPSEKTLRRWGIKSLFAKAVHEWCSDKHEWSDVATICEEVKSTTTENISEPIPDGSEQNGFVYLMKSGKHYKIGRTNALDRRQYEIGLQLPLGITPIHSIATDDPSGIEAYWHHRFKDKRMNGEWFNLNPKDVAIFKKRKFM